MTERASYPSDISREQFEVIRPRPPDYPQVMSTHINQLVMYFWQRAYIFCNCNYLPLVYICQKNSTCLKL
jgi:hypothetical protein